MSEVTSYIEKIRGFAQLIGYSLGTLMVIVLAIVLITGGRDAMQKGKGLAVGILSGVALLSFGVAIITTLQG